MKLHILGICGTFMGGVAALAREQGHVVDGSDQNVYPPMSTQLEDLGIPVRSPYAAENVPPDAEVVVVGRASFQRLVRSTPTALTDIVATVCQRLTGSLGEA